MRNFITALLLFGATLRLPAQIEVVSGGNVGVGTTSPSGKLHINAASGFSVVSQGPYSSFRESAGTHGLTLYPNNGGYNQIYSDYHSGGSALPLSLGAYPVANALTILTSGNVGIGTTTPGTKLEVIGTAAFGKSYGNVLQIGPLSGAPAYVYINTKIPFTDAPAPQVHISGYNYGADNKAVRLTLGWYVYNNAFHWAQYKSELGYHNPSRIRLGTYNDAGTIRVRIEIANDNTYWSSFFISATDHNGASINYEGWTYVVGAVPGDTGNLTTIGENAAFVQSPSGNVGIGTASPSQKLQVVGSVRATSFISDTQTYADFVFKPGYRLAPLSEVEAHIHAHGHLPDVPSEAQVASEGIDLAAMQVKLLQKIEELTLHQIAQEKALQTLRTENSGLRERIHSLEETRP